MSPVTAAGRLAVIDDDLSGFRVTIGGQRSAGITIFLACWLAGWAIGEA